MVAAFWTNWKTLFGVGVALFLPISLITSLNPGEGIEVDEWDGLTTLGALGVSAADVILPLLGTVFYTGIVAATYVRRRHGIDHSIRHVARLLPYLRLAVADVLLILIVALGLLLLFVPGLLFLTWFALIAPLIELEGLKLRPAFTRSRKLVRQSFWPVFAIIVPAMTLQSVVENGGEELSIHLIGESYLGEFVGSFAGNLLSAPIFAIAVLVLYHDLRDLETARKRSAAQAT